MECRICFENDNSEENPLLSPCRCSGTSKYVHLNCIQTWRRANINTQYLTKCRECREKYQKVDIERDRTDRLKNLTDKITLIKNNYNILRNN